MTFKADDSSNDTVEVSDLYTQVIDMCSSRLIKELEEFHSNCSLVYNDEQKQKILDSISLFREACKK